MNEKDRRQLTRMQEQIASYRSSHLPLQGLIADLEFLLSYVEGVEKEWRQEVLARIGRLEDTYAIALDRKAGILGDADHDPLSAPLDAIEGLVRNQLARAKL